MVKDKLIENVVKQIIKEYGGVSDTISEISSNIFYAILNQHRMYFRHVAPLPRYNGKPILCKTFNLDCSFSKTLEKMCHKLTVNLFFYDPDEVSYEDFEQFLLTHKAIKLWFSSSSKTITLTFPWPYNDKVDNVARREIEASINHELKHAYQTMFGRKSPNDTYFRATTEMSHFDNDNGLPPVKWLINYYVPMVYYNLTRSEIDAWMQELYAESQFEEDIKKCPTYKRLISAIDEYKSLKEWYLTKDGYYTAQNIKDYIDKTITKITTPREYFKVCDKNIIYLKSKLRRVIGRWHEEMGNYNGSFKNYVNGEIGQETPFTPTRQKRKGFFKRLFNR